MRILAIIGTLLALAFSVSGDEEKDFIELKFDASWQTYLLKKHGCPIPKHLLEPMGPERCVSPKEIDYTAYIKARKLAMQVFDLRD